MIEIGSQYNILAVKADLLIANTIVNFGIRMIELIANLISGIYRLIKFSSRTKNFQKCLDMGLKACYNENQFRSIYCIQQNN